MPTPISAVRERIREKWLEEYVNFNINTQDKRDLEDVAFNFFLSKFATLLESCLPEEKSSLNMTEQFGFGKVEGWNDALREVKARYEELKGKK